MVRLESTYRLLVPISDRPADVSEDGAAMVSAREAAEILRPLGLSREQGRRVLHTGVAGPGQRLRGSLLYEKAAVCRLLDRPALAAANLDEACRREMFVGRVRRADVAAPWEAQLASVRTGWHLSPYARLRIKLRVERDGFLPFVATVCGFVVLGADLVAACRTPDDRTVLDLRPPGAWFAPLQHTRFVTGPGGPWTLWSAERGHRTW